MSAYRKYDDGRLNMNENKNNSAIGGIGTTGLLGVAFVVLKLCRVINWSWWWVTAPFWIPFCVAVLICVCIMVIAAIKHRGDR